MCVLRSCAAEIKGPSPRTSWGGAGGAAAGNPAGHLPPQSSRGDQRTPRHLYR